MRSETCDECRFDSSAWTDDDLVNTLRSIARRWRESVEGLDAGLLATRPAPEVWSLLEYAAHSRDITATHAIGLAVMAGRPHSDFGGAVEVTDPHPGGDMATVLDGLDAACGQLRRTALDMDPAAWCHTGEVGGDAFDAAWLLRHGLHDLCHHLSDAGRVRHALGAGAPTDKGTVTGLFVSGGGVPKRPVQEATVGPGGLASDEQADRRNHGRPWQAVCLWSTDVVAALAAEGHPIAPGSTGENVSVAGIDWAAIRPGVRISLGPVLVEVSAFSEPCNKIRLCFAGGDYRRVQHARHPGWSRVYATVLEPGALAVADPVVVEPD